MIWRPGGNRNRNLDQRITTKSSTCGVSGCENSRWGGSSMCDSHRAEAQARLDDAERRQGK